MWPEFDEDGDVTVSGWVDDTYLPSMEEIQRLKAEIREANGTEPRSDEARHRVEPGKHRRTRRSKVRT